jgi:hypothetical protein
VISRRALLAGVAAAVALPGTARGFGAASRVDAAELDLGAGTGSRPNAWKRLLFEVSNTTAVEVSPSVVRVKPEQPELFEHPFTVLLGDGAFAPPSDEAIEQLSRYLAYGGFLFVDDTSGTLRSGFDDSVRALVTRLFPTRPLTPLPGGAGASSGHSVFRSFFLLERPVGRVALHDTLEGVSVGNLTPLIYGRNDLSGALDRRDDGRFVQACVPGGEGQRREALKLGINLVVYSLTANYKKDQAHVKRLIETGRME